jgi:hypothetical protein
MRPLARRFLVAAFTCAGLAAPLALAAGASATVNPTHLQATTAAGAYAAPTADRVADGEHITGVKATFFTLQAQRFDMSNPALWNSSPDNGGSTAKGPMLGVELCHAISFTASTDAAVLFVQWNSTSGQFDVFEGMGHASGGCLQAKAGLVVTQIDTIPAGHQVFLALTQGPLGSIHVTDEDLTADVGANDSLSPPGFFFNRGGIGSEQGISDLNSPPSPKLVRFTNDKVREGGIFNSAWVNIGSGVSTRIRTRIVDQANPAGDVFVGSVLNGFSLKLFRGTLNS